MNPIKFLPVDFKPAEALSSSNLQKPKTILTSCQHENEYLLKNNSAADLVNCAHTTLKLSRCTGFLVLKPLSTLSEGVVSFIVKVRLKNGLLNLSNVQIPQLKEQKL